LDKQLVEQALAGDTESFAALCEAHRPRIWRVAASVAGGVEAEDLAQEAFVRAFRALPTFRADAPFGAWLCRIAVNLAHDSLRSSWRRRLPLDDAFAEAASTVGPEGEVERRELQRRVRQAVAHLPKSQRVPIWLHYFEDYTVAAVARLEVVSESTVRSRMQAGLRRLQLSLDDLLPAPERPALPWEPTSTECEA
jgi:RNA polymerase sigma-70 factor (ECF subfamily)